MSSLAMFAEIQKPLSHTLREVLKGAVLEIDGLATADPRFALHFDSAETRNRAIAAIEAHFELLGKAFESHLAGNPPVETEIAIGSGKTARALTAYSLPLPFRIGDTLRAKHTSAGLSILADRDPLVVPAHLAEHFSAGRSPA